MILLDTNVVIDALDGEEANHGWAVNQVAGAVAGEGAAVNAVSLAELASGHRRAPEAVEAVLKAWGVNIVDVPAQAAPLCGKAYRQYLLARRSSGGSLAPKTPLPDFFIGAHAELMGWRLATRDVDRYQRYFPKVELLTP